MRGFVRQRSSGEGLTGRKRLALASLLTGAACLAFIAPRAEAGSIFMKNGYIIQGPVVERTDLAVVLGWPNGKVTIFNRFVDKIDLDPGEEKALAAKQVAAPTGEEELVVNTPVEDSELPASLTELVQKFHLPTALVEAHPLAGGEPASGTEGGETPATGTTPGGTTPEGGTPELVNVPLPAGENLAERVSEARWGFSVQPPAGWKPAEVHGVVSWTGPAAGGRVAPNLNIVSVRRGTLKWDDACQGLREDQKAPLKDYELIAEERIDLGGKHAYRLAGRGGMPIPGGERRVVVRQVLIEEGDRLWLLSAFSDPDAPADLGTLMERSIATFQTIRR